MVIGITGGVGAGKSTVLAYMKEQYDALILMADEIADELLMPGQEALEQLHRIFPKDVFQEDGSIYRKKIAEFIFHNPKMRKRQNDIVFPLVKQRIQELIQQNETREFIVIEAALLIEEHYDEICDVMWYIYSSEQNRSRRLKESRGYSEERIQAVFQSQLSKEEFMAGCQVMIDNDGTVEDTMRQIDRELYKLRRNPCWK